jgi:hypothetical protein
MTRRGWTRAALALALAFALPLALALPAAAQPAGPAPPPPTPAADPDPAVTAPEPTPPAVPSEQLEELIRQADRVTRGQTSAAVVEMQIKTEDYDRTYNMVIWDDARGAADRALVKILGPALWRGHGTLKVGDRLLTYNPKNDHVTVVGSSMLGDSWMGSHFTNDDLVKETSLADDYQARLVRTWQAAAPGVPGEATWYAIALTPRPRAPVVWGRIDLTLYRQGDVILPTRLVYFREDRPDATPVRTMTMSDVRELGGRLLPARMRVEVTDQPGEFTELRYDKIRFDVDIPGEKFTERALRQ